MRKLVCVFLAGLFAFSALNMVPMVDAQFFNAEAQALAPDPGAAEGAETGTGVDLSSTEAIGGLAQTLQSWMAGDLGLLLVMVGLIVAVIMVVARASLMPVLFVLGLAIVLGWGPAIFAGIFNMEVTTSMLEAAVAANSGVIETLPEASPQV
jgi:hypothetical protein